MKKRKINPACFLGIFFTTTTAYAGFEKWHNTSVQLVILKEEQILARDFDNGFYRKPAKIGIARFTLIAGNKSREKDECQS